MGVNDDPAANWVGMPVRVTRPLAGLYWYVTPAGNPLKTGRAARFAGRMRVKPLPIAAPNPWFENATVPLTGRPASTLAGKTSVVAASAAGVTVVAALALGVGLLLMTVAGTVTDAVLVILPLPLPAVPVTDSETLAPLGSSGITTPAPCIFATVSIDALGHCAP